METDFDHMTLGFSIRSSVETRKQELMEQLKFFSRVFRRKYSVYW